MEKRKKRRLIWLSVLFLTVLVTTTGVAMFSIFNGYVENAEGAIPLISDGDESADRETDEETLTGNADALNTGNDVNGNNAQSENGSDKASMDVSDDNGSWTTNTQVEIFKVSYVGGEQQITVSSSDGDKLIAPGTENSYTFKLKNNGDVALDYVVEVDAYFTPADVVIPIEGRVSRYDGKWISGSDETYVNVNTLSLAEDKDTLGAGRYTYYTLDWVWPFETGDDVADTILGNRAVEEDLVFTIVINTYATASTDPDNTNGIIAPVTGDNSDVLTWTIVLSASACLIIFLVLTKKDSRKERIIEE